ncbi:MAG: asparagine synthase [Lachnospiraceae bacterium]|nr:asparagine synthase [Lachnospiraceae bacterium]
MEKVIDKAYCMSSFLSFRYVARPEVVFGENIDHKELETVPDSEKTACKTINDIEGCIKSKLKNINPEKTALLLSGGIDSGILASYMPEGTVAYTVSNPAKAAQIEIERAARVCRKYGLEHRIVEVTWEDYEVCIDTLMKHDGCPVFANEPQVYALTKKIQENGFDTVVIGDNADMAFGGMDRMLSKDWTFDEWVERYTFVKPEKVLVNSASVIDVYERYRTGENSIDFMKFIEEVFAISSSGAYVNAFDCLGMKYLDPYADMKMAEPLDLERVRSGESKYLLRELYRARFPEFEVPEKIAMARAVDTWLKDWEGPKRKEFKEGCIEGMTGEQKFLVYSLERYLNIMNL